MGRSSKHDVFISYSRPDSGIAERLARYLRDNGLYVWLDTWSLVPGANWKLPLEKALEETSSVVLLVGSSGLGRWQQKEFDAFYNKFLTSVFTIGHAISNLWTNFRPPSLACISVTIC